MKEMKEEVQKIIKASFCPKEKWIKDDDAFNCFKCDKKFHALYRRKHHCRYCGQVFCASCSDFYFSGKDIGQAQKSIRMCEVCLQKCWKYVAKHDDTYIQHRKSGDFDTTNELPSNIEEIQLQSKSNAFSIQEKMKEIQMIIEQYTGTEVTGVQKFQKEVDFKFVMLLQVILKQAKIPLKYSPVIKNMAYQILQKLPTNFVITGKINFCQNLRIKGFYAEQFKLSLQPMVLIKKAFTSKRIKDEYEDIVFILVYGNVQSEDLVGGDKTASFENMMNNRLKEMNKIISYCQRVKINMIFLQGNIQKEFEDLFLSNQITVIPKVKVEYLSRLKVSFKIQKIVQRIGDVYTAPEKEVTGNISKITSAVYISAKEGNGSKKFFRMHTAKAELGLTLILQEPNSKIIQIIKKEFKFILQILIHLKLKTYIIKMDQVLLESMNENMRKSCYLNNPEMFFSFYSEYHFDILTIVKEKYVSYKQITYVQSDLTNYSEITNANINEYRSLRTHSFKNKWQNFTEICNSIQDEHKMFYSEEDIPLGSFLLKKFTALDKKCSICCRPNYLHTQVYYSTDQYVKIWAQSMIVDNQDCQSNCYSSFTSQSQTAKNEELQMIFTYLEKNTNKEKLKCYIECFDCQEPISSKENVTKNDIEFSFLSFLQHLFKGSTETKIRENNKKVKTKTSVCNHFHKIRVFQLGSKFVKIFVGKYTINRQCILTTTGRSSFLKNKQMKAVTEVCMLEGSRIQKFMAYLFDQIKEVAQLSKNSKFDSIIKDPRTSFARARSSILPGNNVRLSQAQCIDMIVPQLIEEVSKLNSVAQILLSIKRVENYIQGLQISFLFMSLLKRCYLIINQVKKSVKKRELDQKYQVKDFENDFMENMDINQYLNDNSSLHDTESELANSEISKTQLYSNIQTLDTNTADTSEYQWLQPDAKDEIVISRHDRKTESNILTKRQSKASQEEVHKTFKNISSALRVQQKNSEFLPCYLNKPQSLIAAALNSKLHKQCIQTSLSFSTELTIKVNSYIEHSDLQILENEDIKRLTSLLQNQERRFDINNKFKKQNSTVNLEIIMLHPNQFQILRRKNNIPLELFISSIMGAGNWLASGGKSGSPFMRAYNDLLVIKKIPKGQFLAFKKLLPKYFIHLHEGSLLTPIYGAFILSKNMSSDFYIVMQNLFFGMKEWHLYDFKGSVTKRFSKPPVIPLDINFLVDRCSEPIFSKENVIKNLSSTVNYLCENNVIDYSLILVVEIQNSDDYYLDGNRFQLGIVDYMRQFGAGEWVQNMIKGKQATVVEPATYKTRMLRNIKKYFTQIPL